LNFYATCGGGLQIPFGSNLREAKVDESSRIKIQCIEFLCDKTGGAQIPCRIKIKSQI